MTSRPASSCAKLIPEDWKDGVPGAPLPDIVSAVMGDWIDFGSKQTGQLDKANDRTRSTINIVEKCDARDAETVKQTTKKWWQIWR